MPTLNWIGKDKVVNHHNEVPFRVLEKQYTFGDVPDSGNMIIHGDNLEALKALLPKYEGRIKCIYIDPPYNTGNEGWVYNDNVNDPHIKKWLGQVVGTEVEDLTRHDKWLCMMYPRLVLLQRLLSDDGVIFISIDDNEQASLRFLCDEIFGRDNFVSQLTIESGEVFGTKAAHVNKTFVKVKDYVVVYKGRSKDNIIRQPLYDSTRELFDTHYSKIYINGQVTSLLDYLKRQTRILELFDKFSLKFKKENISLLMSLSEEFKDYIYNEISDKLYADQPYNAEIPAEILEKYKSGEYFEYDGRILFKTKSNTIRMLICFADSVMTSDDYIPLFGRCTLRGDLWKGFHFDMRNIDDEAKVSFKNAKKPVRLIRQLIKWLNCKDCIVLDSFAGSGTTAHAVLNLNKQDGGNRKFILCEMMDYAETITAERVRRVMSGYGEGSNAVEGTGGSFDFYELGTTIFDNQTELLNDEADTEQIRQYVWYAETHTAYKADPNRSNPYLLGTHNFTDYYFYYEPKEETVLDWNFLQTLKQRAEQYIIYADRCLLAQEEMQRMNIVFKKIPRDIKRL